MRRSLIIILIIAALVGAAGLVWFALSGGNNTQTDSTDSAPTPSTSEQGTTTPTQPGTQPSDTGSNQGESLQQRVLIQDFAFSPASLTVKKGTQVTWVNQDSVGHNVLADNPSNSGGLPTSADLLDQGEGFTHTFDTVGTFGYHCGPHPNMKGTVTVTE